MPFENDFGWQRKFLPDLKRIVGEHLVIEAPPEEDNYHNTDLIVLNLEKIRVACRIRRYSYLKYHEEFTIRSKRPSKAKTELAKIVSGWGDYFIYGFANEDETGLETWFLGDLNVFRDWFGIYPYKNNGKAPGLVYKNKDDSSSFRVFKIISLPNEFVKARKN